VVGRIPAFELIHTRWKSVDGAGDYMQSRFNKTTILMFTREIRVKAGQNPGILKVRLYVFR
jgi:hypothetical protein